jgi:hypothetical protein
MSSSTKAMMREADALAQLWRSGGRYEKPSLGLVEFHTERDWKAPQQRIRLDVPYEQKDEAKRCGARWDPQEKTWYTTTVTDGLKRWLPNDAQVMPPSALSVERKRRKGRGMPKAKPRKGFTFASTDPDFPPWKAHAEEPEMPCFCWLPFDHIGLKS